MYYRYIKSRYRLVSLLTLHPTVKFTECPHGQIVDYSGMAIKKERKKKNIASGAENTTMFFDEKRYKLYLLKHETSI